MKHKYTFGGLAALLILIALWMILRPRSGDEAPDKINLSNNVCLPANTGYQVLANDSLIHRLYVEQYWSDSTGQYFSKTLLSPSGDTLLVSVFNKSSLRLAEAALREAGFKNDLRQTVAHSNFNILLALDHTPDGLFFLRRLIADKQFQVVVMVDQMNRDSASLHQKYQEDTFIKSLEKCL